VNAVRRGVVFAIAGAITFSGPAVAAGQGSVVGQVAVSPISVELAIRPSTATAGTRVGAAATVHNLSADTIGKVSVRIRAPSGLLVRPASSKSVRRLAAGSSAVLGWSLCASAPGSYLVFAEATVGTVVVDSPARLFTVTAGVGRCSGRR
jgi:hypothetical protein